MHGGILHWRRQSVAIWKSGPASQYGYACSQPSATYGETGMVWPGAMGFLGAYSQCLSALLVWCWQMLAKRAHDRDWPTRCRFTQPFGPLSLRFACHGSLALLDDTRMTLDMPVQKASMVSSQRCLVHSVTSKERCMLV